jgi:hypothetical protein
MGSDDTGVDFVLGHAFLERFYTVFDAEHKKVGLASTDYTNAVVNN